ncbi:putative polyketide cyclase [Actinoplanes missouriensis 431]|uniref:Putative polyketide cyclase n=1 Tax=Actinoplanes missouriensis (strain ATCC 14538 / DSM 43046 / CBS 188.64 / JCM 3121 / NBRC 102363 / NCIMB 12654 / NRRL B-3342 / UNCC 431) TaxID=512565 RepID=I0HB84_ACTM4|nr:MBL fold metallo-hydrolase [Actinoplanes missouriensis]BAL90271.1 putative polyketide cyclase [Actinoplanes missouriensis 431]
MNGTESLTEVGDGVLAYVQRDGGWCVNNAGVLVSGGSVALIDTVATEARARRLRERVLAATHATPFAVINTHSHGDHTFGNFVFPEATMYAHHQTRAEMRAAGLHLTELWPDVEWGDITLVPPAVTYAGGLTLHVGDLRAELIHMGVAHSTNDTVVWLPEQRVLFTGDIVMAGVTPFCPLGSVAGSIAAIQRLRDLAPLTVVAGHGLVGGPEVLDGTERYLRWVQDLARAGSAAGSTPAAVARDADLGEFAELRDPERLVPNLHRAFAEERDAAHGGALDMTAAMAEMSVVFREMVEYRGGPVVCHA